MSAAAAAQVAYYLARAEYAIAFAFDAVALKSKIDLTAVQWFDDPDDMPLTYGSDCSGIECPSEALRCLGVEFEHLFASEKYRTARKWIDRKWEPRRMDRDVTTRDHSTVPQVD